MLVKARYKDVVPEEWFDVELTDDQKMIDVATGTEIKRTDLLIKSNENEDVIDMEEEWENYRSDMIQEDMRLAGKYLLWQMQQYSKGEPAEIPLDLVYRIYTRQTRNPSDSLL